MRLKYLYQGKLSGYQKWIDQLKLQWKQEKEQNHEINQLYKGEQ